MVSPVSGGDSQINYTNPVDPTEGTDQVAQTAEEQAAADAQSAADAQATAATNQTTNTSTTDDLGTIQLRMANAAAREILERFDPDEIAYAIKVNPSGNGSGATNPFELFNSMGSGGSSPGGSTGL